MIYKLALFVHITNAIVTIGPLFTIFVTLHKMKSLEDKQQIQGTIEGIRSMIRTVEIGGHFIVPTGIIVLLLGGGGMVNIVDSNDAHHFSYLLNYSCKGF